MTSLTPQGPPERTIHCMDALTWLRGSGIMPGASVVTSMPDISEVGMDLTSWRAWFGEAAALCVGLVEPTQAALFYQSDIKLDGRWIDKGALVIRAAEDAGAHVLFHKVISRRQPGLLSHGRPGYTHLIAVSRELRCPDELEIPDVIIDPGPVAWVRAMGVRAAAHGVRFVRDVAKARCVVDPFCGVGTIPAVANLLGLDAIGVELSRKRAERARELVLRTADLEAPARAKIGPWDVNRMNHGATQDPQG